MFDNQFEIRIDRDQEGSFSFSIFKKNELVYFSDARLRHRKDCDLTVGQLQERTKRGVLSYCPRESGGTHWVEIADNHGILCQSKSLRSRDEAEDLIEETVEKIPYCKYDRG